MITVTVFSALRQHGAPADESRWTGQLPDDALPGPRYAELAFRYFNRVDDADCDRLESIGYRLPSMTAGDYFAVKLGDDVAWEIYYVAPVGMDFVGTAHPRLTDVGWDYLIRLVDTENAFRRAGIRPESGRPLPLPA